MSNTSTRVANVVCLHAMPADMYGEHDSEHRSLKELLPSKAAELARQLNVSPEVTHLEARVGRTSQSQAAQRLVKRRPELLQELRCLHARTYFEDESPLHIVDVSVVKPVLSDSPFRLDVHYQNVSSLPVVLTSVVVAWAGDPFVLEQEIRDNDRNGAGAHENTINVCFGEESTLPVGPAEFEVTLFRQDGAMASFVRTVYVLPSNPLSLALSPDGARVTGSWSARGDYQPASDTFLTECEITLANGDFASVGMNRAIYWEFWDGPVGGGTLVESGSFDWPSPVAVSALGVWRGAVSFASPRDSGVFRRYDRKEDMSLSICMTANDGRVIRGEISTRVMLSFGVNVIKVGAFGVQENYDLYAAVDRMRQIFERRDITLRAVNRFVISDAQAGGYAILNTEDEVRDMWEDWSCSNDCIDVYVVQDFQWKSFNGFAGAIPGPSAKGGREDGVAVDKTGFTDASGTLRLNVATLSRLIGHEVGHYLGLNHLEDANNLMRSNTGSRGPDLNYDQYRLMFPHGYVHYE